MDALDLHGRCPIDLAIDVVGGKWKPIILYRLGGGTMRFGELQRAIPAVTQRMLTLQLRELERDGLLSRTVYAEVPPRVEYTLTEPARAMLPILESLGHWLIAHHGELRKPAAAKPKEKGGEGPRTPQLVGKYAKA
jgi:DNA-binding HxlR family transcriptional regulator